jgi:diguanylate cyclase (GGDEF)-like protein
MKRVRDIMAPVSYTLKRSDNLDVAVRLMSEMRVSCVLVSSDGVPEGIITERDIVRLVGSSSPKSLSEIPLAEIMTKDPICVEESTEIKDALSLSRSRAIRHLPVLDQQQRLSGLVTQNHMIDAYINSFAHAEELEDANEALKALAMEDALVSAGNRRALEIDLAHTHATSLRHNRSYSIAMIDLDYFKRYNDRYGHQKGDEALIAVVEIIRQVKRSSDRVYRYGGEEILLLLPDTELADSQIVAERARRAIEEKAIPHQDSEFGIVTASIGLAQNADSPEEVVLRADKALYTAKKQGRNKVFAA